MVWSSRIKFSKQYFLDETSGKSCDPVPFKRYFNIVPFKHYFNIVPFKHHFNIVPFKHYFNIVPFKHYFNIVPFKRYFNIVPFKWIALYRSLTQTTIPMVAGRGGGGLYCILYRYIRISGWSKIAALTIITHPEGV